MNWNLTITLQDISMYVFVFAMFYIMLQQIKDFGFIFAMLMGFGMLAVLIGLPFLLLP
jgi:hypothetical protein